MSKRDIKTGKSACWENPGEVFLSEVLEWCLQKFRVDTLLVTSRASGASRGKRSFDPAVERNAKSIFGKNLITQFHASGWPGTRLVRHTARVYVVRFDAALMRRLVTVENKLFNWTHHPKHLPEDICVFRNGSRLPVLVSVTHEGDAFILSDRRSSPPGFERSDLPPKYWHIWDGPYFCRV
jgi:hypothetical protein